jgi:hypothetical protein
MIQNVGEGGLEAQFRALGDREVLRQTERDRSRAKPLENAYACIAEAAGASGRGSKGCEVEVLSMPSAAVCL